MELPEGQWTVYINGEDAGTTPLATAEGSVSVDPISAMVLVKEASVVDEQIESFNLPGLIVYILAGVLLLSAGAVTAIILIKKKRK